MEKVAEKPPQIEDMIKRLKNSDDSKKKLLAEIAGDRWNNPDKFAEGDLTGYEEVEEVLIFQLGLIFGIAFEEAYPSGKQEEWPIPLNEREGHKVN